MAFPRLNNIARARAVLSSSCLIQTEVRRFFVFSHPEDRESFLARQCELRPRLFASGLTHKIIPYSLDYASTIN